MSIIYFILAALGLSFLVFIHELGHYIVAIRNGMRVEMFSIGFGKPIVKWKIGEVEWRICYILFGGFVKVAGQEREGNVEPHDVVGGFYHASPWSRIKMAAMGPIVNIVFAFLAFSAIWILGGREQPFARHTKIIGWVDPGSDLHAKGVKAGDELTQVDGRSFRGFRDLMYASVIAGETVKLQGEDINYFADTRETFNLSVATYPDPRMGDKGLKSFGIMTPAQYMIYPGGPDEAAPIQEGSPMFGSGLEKGDRIVWINGELIFSLPQMSHILNQNVATVTVNRGGSNIDVSIPKRLIGDLRLPRGELQEFEDWKHALKMEKEVRDLQFIPYLISPKGVVLSPLKFIDSNSNEIAESALKKGDVITAVDGKKVHSGYEVLEQLQSSLAHIIVQRNSTFPVESWKNEDQDFVSSVNYNELAALISANSAIKSVGNLHKLKPVAPMSMGQFTTSKEHQEHYQAALAKEEARIRDLPSVDERAKATAQLNAAKKQLYLGVPLTDLEVIYNPNPLAMMGDVASDTYRTLGSLFSGRLNPKWLSGPIGFVQVMHHGWSVGFKEALYWLGLISMGLGIFNLFPIPALDGGHICFSIYEWITKKRIKAKVMERMILPFVILIIGLFIFVTYQDILRVVTQAIQ